MTTYKITSRYSGLSRQLHFFVVFVIHISAFVPNEHYTVMLFTSLQAIMATSSERIPTTMHAWRKHRGNPEPQWDEVSDVGVLARDGQAPHDQEKFVVGHEGCGDIVATGANISDFKIGDRVAINPVAGCGESDCPDCSNNFMQLCQRGLHHGLRQYGSFADYIAISTRSAVKVPSEAISSAAAAVSTDAVMTTHHAIIRRGKVKREDTVFLFGLGGLGFNALQILLHVGCKVYVSETRQEPLEEAVRLGLPKECVVPIGTDVKVSVQENGLEDAIDVVVDIAGLQQTFSDAQVIGKYGLLQGIAVTNLQH